MNDQYQYRIMQRARSSLISIRTVKKFKTTREAFKMRDELNAKHGKTHSFWIKYFP